MLWERQARPGFSLSIEKDVEGKRPAIWLLLHRDGSGFLFSPLLLSVFRLTNEHTRKYALALLL
jgi:hypothetical protein